MVVILYTVNLNTMRNFLFVRLVVLGLWFFALQQHATANTSSNNCNTQTLGPNDPLLITIFDNAYKAAEDNGLWDNLCAVIKQFPKNLVTMEYRPGALATGSRGNLKCGSSDNCDIDAYHGCELFYYQYINVCGVDAQEGDNSLVDTINCFCKHESDQLLLENAGFRAAWNVPETAVPTLTFNKKYDQCATIGSVDEITNYLCTLYQKQVAPCK